MPEQPTVFAPYVDGVDLVAVLEELTARDRCLEPPLAAWIVQEVLEALDRAHSAADPIIHGDLSPARVLLGVAGEVRVVGFGDARGAPRRLDVRDDVFAAGVLLAELLCGMRLYVSVHEVDMLALKLQRVEAALAEVDYGLADIAMKSVRRAPDARWATAAAFRNALAAWLREQGHHMTVRHVVALVAEARGIASERISVTRTKTGRSVMLPRTISRQSTPILGSRTRTQSVPPPVAAPPLPARTEVHGTRPPRRTTRGMLHLNRTPSSTEPPRLASERPRTDRVEMSPLGEQRSEPIPRVDSFSDAYNNVVIPPTIARTVTPVSFDDLFDAPPPMPEPAADAPALPADGDLAATSPIRVLYRLMVSRATGRLELAFNTIKKDVFFRDGQIESIASNIASESVEHGLVARHVLSSGEVAMALASVANQSGKLGDALVKLGLLKPNEVRRHWNDHARASLIDACTWKKGTFVWIAGAESANQRYVTFDPFEALGAGALALADGIVTAWSASHASAKFVAEAPPRIDPARFAIEGLPRLLAALDGRSTLDELLNAQPDARARGRCVRLVLLLDACELASPT